MPSNTEHGYMRFLRILFLGAASIVFAAAACAWGMGLRFTLTRSLPAGVYQLTDAALAPGTIALFCPPEEAARLARRRRYLRAGPCPGGAEPLGKYALAQAGDHLRIGPDGIHLNGKPVERSRVYERDRQGRPLPHVPFGEFILGSDSVFMFSGHHPRSFDSRYFGAVPRKSILSTARPLWTFD